jgi:hypothetical protein
MEVHFRRCPVYLNAFRIRLALMGAGVLTLGIYLAMGGRLGPSDRGVVQIEYGIEPGELDGLAVEIDGQVVGKLRPFGSSYRTGFLVREGLHQVKLLHPTMDSEERRVEVSSTQPVLLVVDFQSRADERGAVRSVLGFQ